MLRRRSWMFVPGNSERMISIALTLDLDVAMLDLEDGVVPALKHAARPVVAAALAREHTGRPYRFVRVNGHGTPDLHRDLEAIVCPGLEGIVVPKIETVLQVESIALKLDALEASRSVRPGQVKMMLAIETAKAVIAAPQLASGSERVCGLMFGAEDFSRDIGLPTVRTGHARDFLYARSAIVMAAVAAGVTAVDGVWPVLQDREGLTSDSRLARDLGFAGKSMIHPGQIDIINQAFSPTPDEVEHARRLIGDFEVAMANGQGSISFEGELVDRPIYERALAVVRAAHPSNSSAN